MDTLSIKATQEVILEGIYKMPASSSFDEMGGIVGHITSFGDDVVHVALGDFGLRLKNFAESVDIEHPGMHILDGQLTTDSPLSKKLFQFLKVAEFAVGNNLLEVLPCIAKMATKNMRKDIRSIDSPIKTGEHLRLLNNASQLSQMRRHKASAPYSMTHLFKNSMDAWSSAPSSFSMYIPNDDRYREEMARAKQRQDKYLKLGLKSFGAVIDKSIQEFEMQFSTPYYGFRRITVSKAVVIQAKLHGYCNNTEKGVGCPPTRGSATYCPTIAPLWTIEDFLPDSVKQVANHLDNFPAANGKAIFDHFILVVPSGLGAIDKMAMKDGRNSPVLLGEADGKCYFVSYCL